MAWREGSIAIWDWERSSHSVPVGLDGAFDFQVALAASRHRSIPALRQTLRATRRCSPISRSHATGGACCSRSTFSRLALRWEEGRQAGMTEPDSMYAPALAALLDQSPRAS
jgi:hypothetical protein